MGYISVTITLKLYGEDVGPFELKTDADNYATTIDYVTLPQLSIGYTCNVVPDTATIIRVESTGSCTNYIDLPILGLPNPVTPTPTVTPTITPTVTPTVTPTPSYAPDTYTIYLNPTVLTNTSYSQIVTSPLYVSPPLPEGLDFSFKLNYTNSGTTIADEQTFDLIYAIAERKLLYNSNSFDRIYASIPNCDYPPQCNDSEIKTGYVIVTPSNINNIYFRVNATIHQNLVYSLVSSYAKSVLTSITNSTGATFVIDGLNNYISASRPIVP